MAAGTVIKHKRKSGAFTGGELQAGEMGLDVSGNVWYYSTNGSTVNSLGGSGDMLKSVYDSNDDGKVSSAVTADQLGGVVASLYALKSYVDAAIAGVINSAPGALDTLDELAAAFGDDANFAATMTTALAGKAATSHNHAASDLTGDIATARMQTNVAAALQASGTATVSNSAVTLDGGTI